jgi:hypothetical protein
MVYAVCNIPTRRTNQLAGLNTHSATFKSDYPKEVGGGAGGGGRGRKRRRGRRRVRRRRRRRRERRRINYCFYCSATVHPAAKIRYSAWNIMYLNHYIHDIHPSIHTVHP